MKMPATYGTGKQGVAILPLALILVLHLMLVLLWATRARMHIDQGAEQRHFTLAWLPALTPRAAPPSAPARRLQAQARVARARAVSASRAPQLVTLTAQAEMPQPSSVTPASAPDAPNVNQIIESAKRQAGLIDRELRAGKPAPLKPNPDLPINRFRSALESAYIDRSSTTLMDSYTQADGVIVYRFRQGGKVWCRQSGGGAPGMMERSEGAKLAGAGSAGGGSAAGTVQCPSGEIAWSRR
jgi:hypothetical protein